MIFPELSTSKKSKAALSSSSVTRTPPLEFLGTRSSAPVVARRFICFPASASFLLMAAVMGSPDDRPN